MPKRFIPDCEPEGVDLAEPLFVWKGWYVLPESFECVVDGLHSFPFSKVCRVTLMHLLTHRGLPVADAALLPFAARVVVAVAAVVVVVIY